jgi:DNA primase
MNSPIQQIKERLTIEEVVSSYIPLIKVGNSLKAKCPFHNEKTPSFFISAERNSYYCFGCAKGGDIFSFVEEFEGLDFKGALKLLADRAGVKLDNFNSKEEGEKEKLYRVMEEATKFFENNLIKNSEALEYLKSRGLKKETIKDFRLGVVPDLWRELYTYLKQKGFNDIEIEKAGLAKKTEKGFYDRFRGRIMFPIMDSSGRVIAFSGRIFGKASENPVNAKYLNSPETPIFIKSSVLYGLDKAKEHIRKHNFSILVEGQLDLLLSHQAGWKNTIATSGTALSDSTFSKENSLSNLGLVRRLSSNIVLSFDGDKAGFSATERAGKIALVLGMDVKVTNLPEGLDPADLILRDGLDSWKDRIKNSKHIIEFISNKIVENFKNDSRKIGREVKEKVLPYLVLLPSSIEVAHFLKYLSDTTGIPMEALKNDLKQVERESGDIFIESIKQYGDKESIDREESILERLFGVILWQKDIKNQVLPVDNIIKIVEEILNTKIDEFLDKFKLNRERLVFKAEEFYSKVDEQILKDIILKDVKDLLGNLKIKQLEKLAEKKKQESNNSDASSQEFLLIKIQIEDIKNGRSNFLKNI